MADQQAWTIGAAPECDIVVNHPTVSGRHCRLTRAGDGFLIEDLDSTNGTFVNGTRITAPVGVTADDDVKLGPETRFPWEKIVPQAANREIIRIGRDSDNDVVLDYANVSGHHARIVIDDGEATIEDLGSTNGISIGKPDNLVKSAPLKESDTVYFGSLAVSATELLSPGGTPVVLEGAAGSSASSGGASITPRAMAVTAALVVVVAVAAGTIWKSFSGGDKPTEQPSADVAAADNGSDDGTKDGQAAPKSVIAEKPADAIYSVLVQQRGVDPLLQIGTAWAVSDHQLVTSGVVTRYLEKYAKDISAIQVRCPSLDKLFVVTSSVVHPEFKKAESAIQAPAQVAEAKREELEKAQSAETPPSQEELDKLVEQLIDANEKMFLAGEQMVFFDVGLLTVEETLPAILEVESPARKLPLQSKSMLLGVPFDPETMVSLESKPVETVDGRLLKIVHPIDKPDDPLTRLTFSSPTQHHDGKEWRGGPVLNDEGRVIAIYVRPAPPVDPKKPITGESFDAVLVEQLQDLSITLPQAQQN